MNRIIIFVTLSIILASHFGYSSGWPNRADAWPSSTHQEVRRASLPNWFKTLQNVGRLNSDGRLRKNRDAEDIFSGGDSAPVVSERYIQQSQNGKVIASNSKANSNNMEESMIFGDGNTDKVPINRADFPLESGASSSSSIDFGVQDRMKNRSPRPPCNKTSGLANVGDSQAKKSEEADVSSTVDFIDQPDWTPVVNETQCQSYGPSQFCENVTNYPEETIARILRTDNGSLLTTFFTDNTQPFPSASESDESMVLAQRKPGAPVTAHAINTRIKPFAASGEDGQTLCESITNTWLPKSGKNKNNENLFIINQDYVVQQISVETCANKDGKCRFSENFPAGFEAVCVQKYVTHHLAALKNGKMVRESFPFPSCCVCVLKMKSRDNLPVSIARRSIEMPSSHRRMAAEVDGQQSP